MAPLPASRSRIDAVGKRLAAGTATREDEVLYERLLAAHSEALGQVQAQLEACGLAATGRLKTSSTLLDKVARGTSLKSVQDIAGCRIVVDGGRWEQSVVVKRVLAAVAPDARVIDRIASPQHGYRAIHVVARADELPVEIQVRTHLQDVWAQIVEALGDAWGRELRYTGMPLDPDRAVVEGSTTTRRDVIGFCQVLSQSVDRLEETTMIVRAFDEGNLDALVQPDRVSAEVPDSLRQDITESRASIDGVLRQLTAVAMTLREEAK